MSWGELLFNVFIGSSQFIHDNKKLVLLTDLLDFTKFSASMRKKISLKGRILQGLSEKFS